MALKAVASLERSEQGAEQDSGDLLNDASSSNNNFQSAQGRFVYENFTYLLVSSTDYLFPDALRPEPQPAPSLMMHRSTHIP